MKDQQGGVVERGDCHHNTDGLGKSEPNLVESGTEVGVQGKRFSVALGALKSGEANDFASPGGFATGFSNAFAHLGADGVGEGFDSLIGNRRCLQQYRGALVGGSVAPEGSTRHCALECGIGVGGACRHDFCQSITGIGRAHGVDAGVCALRP